MNRVKTLVDESTEAVFSDKLGIWLRPATTDNKTPTMMSEYRQLGIQPGETVIDGGGNIGCFVRWAMQFSPRLVVTLEPDATNFNLLMRNTQPYADKVLALQKAISHEASAILYLNTGKGKDSHSTVAFKGRPAVPVSGISLVTLVDEYRPARIKLDIEGEEHAWLPTFTYPDYVLGVTAEIHFQRKDSREKGRQACENIERQGFKAVRQYKDTGQNWHTTATWRRD